MIGAGLLTPPRARPQVSRASCNWSCSYLSTFFTPPGRPTMKKPGPASNTSYPLSAGLTSALNYLRQAYDCAQESRQSPWEFAIEMANLESAGLSHTDSRWLIGKGYVEHAV